MDTKEKLASGWLVLVVLGIMWSPVFVHWDDLGGLAPVALIVIAAAVLTTIWAAVVSSDIR